MLKKDDVAKEYITVQTKYSMTGGEILRETGCAAENIIDHAISALELHQERREKSYASRRVIVIPGYLQWGDAPYRPLEKQFRRGEADIVASNTRFWTDLNYSAQRVAEQIYGMNGNGEVIDALVGHSMGGLIATKVAQIPGIRERIKNVICLATPFGGTPVAYLGMATRSARQMLPELRLFGVVLTRSAFLDELEKGEYDPRTRVVHIYGSQDKVVPVESAKVGRAHEKVELPLGHFSILYDDSVHQLIRERVLRQTQDPSSIL